MRATGVVVVITGHADAYLVEGGTTDEASGFFGVDFFGCVSIRAAAVRRSGVETTKESAMAIGGYWLGVAVDAIR